MTALGTEVNSRTLNVQTSKVLPALVMDLAERIKGFYRLLDLISEPARSGSSGCGEPFDVHRSYPQTELMLL
jgi:hypothetical protein